MPNNEGDSIQVVAVEPRVRIKEVVTIWILFFINLFNYIDRYIVAGALEEVMEEFNLSFFQGGLLTTAFIVCYMVLSPLFGFLGDRYRRSWLIAIGLFLWAAATFLCSIAQQYWQLVLLRAMVGIGEASYAALAPTIIADLIPESQRTFYLSFFYIGTPIGGALGYIIGGGVSDAFGWRWSFRVTPPLVILLGIASIIMVQDPERGGSDNIRAETSSLATYSAEIRAARNPIVQLVIEVYTVLKTKTFLFATLGFSCLAFTIGSLTQWIPVYVVKASAIAGTPYDNSEANYVFGILTCAGGFVSIPMGSVVSKMLEKYTPKNDCLINAVGMLLTSLSLYLGIALAPYNINYFWGFTSLTQLFAFVGWAPNTAVILYTCPAQIRSLAQAVNILFSHLFGDALSPTIQGKLSDQIKDAFSDYDISISECVALEYSFFLSCFVCVLGSIFYFLAAENVVQDRLLASDTVVSRAPTISSLPRSRTNTAADPPPDVTSILRDEHSDDGTDILTNSTILTTGMRSVVRADNPVNRETSDVLSSDVLPSDDKALLSDGNALLRDGNALLSDANALLSENIVL